MEYRPDQSDHEHGRRAQLLEGLLNETGSTEVYVRMHAPEIIDSFDIDELNAFVNEVPSDERSLVLATLGAEALAMGDMSDPADTHRLKGSHLIKRAAAELNVQESVRRANTNYQRTA